MAKFSSALWFRTLALCIALGAGGGYVWMRQREAAPVPSTAPVEEGKIVNGIFPVEGEVTDMEEVLMSTSKSGIIFEELESDEDGIPPGGIVIEPAPGPMQDGKPRRLLPGSKSIGGVIEGRDLISDEDADRVLEKRGTGTEQKSQEP